ERIHTPKAIQTERGPVLFERLANTELGGTLGASVEHEASHHEAIHVGSQEARVRVLRGTNDRLAANVERRVDQHGTPGRAMECLQELSESRLRVRTNRLDARRSI